MSNELRDFIKFLQYRNNYTIEQVAKRIGYDRAYLNMQMNKKQDNEGILKQLHKEFPADVEVYGGVAEKEGPRNTGSDISTERLIQALEENNAFLRNEIKKHLVSQQTWFAEIEASLKKYILGLALKSHAGLETILDSLEHSQNLPKKSLAKNADSKLVVSAGQFRKKGKGPARGSSGKT